MIVECDTFGPMYFSVLCLTPQVKL